MGTTNKYVVASRSNREVGSKNDRNSTLKREKSLFAEEKDLRLGTIGLSYDPPL